MVIPRLGGLIFVGAFLLALAAPAPVLHAQTADSGQSTALSYDDLAAKAKRAEAEKEAAADKQAKQNKHGMEEPSVPAAAPAAAAEPPVAVTESGAPAADVKPAAAAKSDATPPAAAGPVPPSKVISHVYLGKLKTNKEKPPKPVPVNIIKGELTVDGLIAKAGLNFQIIDIKYLYIWVPGLGTAVMSNQFFPGSKLQDNALDGNQITVKVDGHQLQLACDHQLLSGKKPKPLGLYVALDKEYQKSSIYPEFGYGDVNKAPYTWPGSLVDANTNTQAPPLPPNLRQETQSVKLCQKNPDGTDGSCRTVEVPLVLSKKS